MTRKRARRLARLFAILCLTLPGLGASSAREPSTAAIQAETLRQEQRQNRLISFWWFPTEYWKAAAREAGRSAPEVRRAAILTESYVILAGLDVEIAQTGSITGRDHTQMAEGLRILVDGELVESLKGHANPELVNALRELSYVLRVALGPLGPEARIFLFPNLSDDQKPRFAASQPGVLEARYRLGPKEGDEILDLVWRSPLTSLAGPGRCPQGGESVDASWAYCPWHGVKLH